jgi:hypothetical protein
MARAGSLSGLIKYIHRTDWDEALDDVLAQHLGPACRNFDIEPDEIAQILDAGHSMTLWGCALEDFMASEYDGGRNVVDEYLKRRGYAESGGAKHYMQALRGAVMSLYEVSDVVPGQSFLARDLIRGGDPVRVIENSGTQTLKAWDRIAARLLYLGSDWRMGGGVLLFQRRAAEFVIAALQRMDGWLPNDLREYADRVIGPIGTAQIDRYLAEVPPLSLAGPTFTGVWLADALDRALNPQLPQLHNTDGDPIVMCTSTFPLLAGVKAAQCRAALADVPGLLKESAKLFNWVRNADDESKEKLSGQTKCAITMTATNSRGDTLLGRVEIKKGTVVLSTNSRKRAARGEALIAGALRALVGEPAREEVTADDMLAETARRPRKPRAEIPPEQARAIIHGYLDQHYRKTLDEPIPALGGISPREAARSEAGRAKVVDWLKNMENHAAKAGGGADPMASYDFGWIWRDLGVAEFRV